MFILVVFLVLTTRWGWCRGQEEDICQVCDCFPKGLNPVQAFCVDIPGNEVFSVASSSASRSLELVYISGVEKVHFDEDSFETERPVTLVIQKCSNVHISDHSLLRLRTLIIRGVRVVQVGTISPSYLWAILLEDIEKLTLDSASFDANYSVQIGHVRFLNILSSREERSFDNPELQFSLFSSVIEPIQDGALVIGGSVITMVNNKFKSIAEGGFQVVADKNITMFDNTFEHLEKKVFNLSSPEIHISGNHFKNLPAGALSGVSTIQDTFFTNNTVEDIDLGGVLLDMSWDMIVEQNTIECDCASKRTSILNPKPDMLYLTDSSNEKLQNIFLENFCRLNCTVTLKAFSYALIHGNVCLTNDTRLEQEQLCDITIVSEPPEESETERSFVSAANRVELLVPLSIIVVTVLLMSSVCYGCKEMKTFKFTFEPNRNFAPKVQAE